MCISTVAGSINDAKKNGPVVLAEEGLIAINILKGLFSDSIFNVYFGCYRHLVTTI